MKSFPLRTDPIPTAWIRVWFFERPPYLCGGVWIADFGCWCHHYFGLPTVKSCQQGCNFWDDRSPYCCTYSICPWFAWLHTESSEGSTLSSIQGICLVAQRPALIRIQGLEVNAAIRTCCFLFRHRWRQLEKKYRLAVLRCWWMLVVLEHPLPGL